jgi:flavin reductase
VVTRQEYRDAMARFGAAVSVVTTDGPGGKRGFTASAVCSVTDDPPTLLVCVNRQNESHPALIANKVMAVNTLSADQQDLSNVFATGEAAKRFASGHWTTLRTGAPVLHGCVVSFDCRVAQITDVGTHSVVFAKVEAIRYGATEAGLIYFGRGYHPVRHPAATG